MLYIILLWVDIKKRYSTEPKYRKYVNMLKINMKKKLTR